MLDSFGGSGTTMIGAERAGPRPGSSSSIPSMSTSWPRPMSSLASCWRWRHRSRCSQCITSTACGSKQSCLISSPIG